MPGWRYDSLEKDALGPLTGPQEDSGIRPGVPCLGLHDWSGDGKWAVGLIALVRGAVPRGKSYATDGRLVVRAPVLHSSVRSRSGGWSTGRAPGTVVALH